MSLALLLHANVCSTFPPTGVLPFYEQLPEGTKDVIAHWAGGTKQNRKSGLFCAANEEAASLSRGYHGAVTW